MLTHSIGFVAPSRTPLNPGKESARTRPLDGATPDEMLGYRVASRYTARPSNWMLACTSYTRGASGCSAAVHITFVFIWVHLRGPSPPRHSLRPKQ